MKRLNLTVPTGWNKLTAKQLLKVSGLFLAKLEFEEFRLRIFLYLSGVKALPKKVVKDQVYWLFNKGKTEFMMDRQELAWLLHSVEFLTVDSRLTVNKFTRIWLPIGRVFGPTEKCYSITYLEFIHAEAALYAYQQTSKVEHLNHLCAILYRPQKKDYHPLRPDFDGDRREPFNDFIYRHRAKWFNFVSIRKRFAIYLFYTGCRNELMDSFKNLFSGSSVSSDPVNPVKSLRKIIHDLNMGDLTKNETIYKMQVWEAFEHLEHLIQNLPKKKKNG